MKLLSIKRALRSYTRQKTKTTLLYKKEVEKGNSGIAAEARRQIRMADAGELLSRAIRKAIRQPTINQKPTT